MEELEELLEVFVVLKVSLRYTPKPTMRIITITMTVDTPRETALFAFANMRQQECGVSSYLKLDNSKSVLTIRTSGIHHSIVRRYGFPEIRPSMELIDDYPKIA